MILFKCDRCGQAISPYVHRLGCEIYRNTDYGLRNPVNILIPEEEDPEAVHDELSIRLYSMQFCRECYEKIAEFALDPNATTTSAAASKQYRDDLDGPIKAFYTANPPRSIAWIADEIGVSEQTVRNHLRRMGLWKGGA